MSGRAYHPRLTGEVAVDPSGRVFDPRMRALAEGWAGDNPDPLATEATLTLLAVSRHLVESLEVAMAPHDLSMSRFAVLIRLWRRAGGEAPLNELAESCQVSPRNITGLVDGLEEAGLVARAEKPGDRRVTLARLTDAGRELIARVARENWQRQSQLMAVLPEDDQRLLIDLCVRLSAAAPPVPPPHD